MWARSSGHDAGPPVWVIASAGLAIGLGTRTTAAGASSARLAAASPTSSPRRASRPRPPPHRHPHLRSTSASRALHHPGLLRRHPGRGPSAGASPRQALGHRGPHGHRLCWFPPSPVPPPRSRGLSATVVVGDGGNLGTALIALDRRRRGRIHRDRLAPATPVHADNVNETHEVTIRSGAKTTDVRTAA
ncbi:hypothetical protein ACRAWF_34935 [Streptomyces sp. L7]